MSNSTHSDAIDSSLSMHDNEQSQETGMSRPTDTRESTNDSNPPNYTSSSSTNILEDAQTQHPSDQSAPSTASAQGASHSTANIPLPAGQAVTDSDPHDHTPRPNSHLESWRFDSASGRFVPHTFEGNMFGRPSSASSSNAEGPQANQTPDSPRIPEIILQTSTDISVHGPDGQQLPPEASQFLLRMLGTMGGGPSTSNGPSAVPDSASGAPAGSTAPNTSASQTSTSTTNPFQSTEPMADGPNPSRSGPSFFDLLRELAALQERQSDPPPDTRRAKQLLRGLPVVSHGLIRRLQRVETLKARALAQKQGASAKEVEEADNKLMCLVCYEALLPETESKVDQKQTGDAMNGAKDDGMKVDDDEDDMDLDVPTDISPSDSKHPSETKPAPPTVTHRWPYQAQNALIALPCTHVFHATCLKPWFETGKTTCPTCRFDIDPGSDSLDLADWLSPRRRRRQREQRQREREREQAANGGSTTEDASEDRSNATTEAQTPVPASTTPTPGGNAANDDHATPGAPPSGIPSQISQAIHQAMVSAIARAILGGRPPAGPAPTETNQDSSSQPASTPSNASTSTPSANSSNAAVPPPPAGFPFELLHLLSRAAPPAYPMEGVIIGGSFDIPPANNGVRATSPTPPGSQRSTSAPPSAPMQPTPAPAPTTQSPAPSAPAINSYSSTFSGPARTEPRTPFLSAGLGPNGMSPFRRLSSFLSRPFAPPVSSQQSSTPTTGSSTSSFATGSRPSTPSFRHHPYASSRPSSQASNQTQARETESQETPADTNAENRTSNNPGDGFVTTHTISFTFEIPLGLRGPRTTGQNNGTTPGASQDDAARTNTAPEPDAQPQDGRVPSIFGFPPGLLFGGLPFGFVPAPPLNPFELGAGLGAAPGASANSSRGRRQKKKWVAPEGSSLRSVVEAKEREVGLRCDDVSCLFGPEDEDEEDNGENVDMGVKSERVYLKKPAHLHSNKGEIVMEEPACTHRLHPECLLVSSRIADPFLNDAIDKADEHDSLEVGCPICRTRGVLSVAEWRRLKQLADQV